MKTNTLYGVAPDGVALNRVAPAAVSESELQSWQDAVTAAALLAIDPGGLAGVLVRAMAGPVRDRWVQTFLDLLPEGTPVGRAHPNVDDARLVGGLDLARTLQTGRPELQTGLLAESHGGVLIMSMSERLPASMVSELCGALDNGQVLLEREGFSRRLPARFGAVMLDEGMTPDEGCAPALADRLALHVDLAPIPWSATATCPFRASDVAAARDRLAAVDQGDDLAAALCRAAAELGVSSLRAVLLALRAARAAAALFGADAIAPVHAQVAARLVLGPRARQTPPQPAPAGQQQQPDGPDQGDGPAESDVADEQPAPDLDDLTELLVHAARATLPEDPFAAARRPRLLRGSAGGARGGRVGPVQRQGRRGRQAGSLPGALRSGDRLDLLATLRAAAPWQRLRRNQDEGVGDGLRVRAEDLRIKRYQQRAATVTIFVVDASGSAAMQRLAEAKGAVELLLADCYVRRDEVALIAFRGRGAELLLPPTRSLVRAKRNLARLVGGGATPLAAGIAGAAELAGQVLRRGSVPFVVLLTDARPNVTLSGEADRRVAAHEALAEGRRLRALDIGVVLIDTSPRGQAFAGELADAMNGGYQRLPFADARHLSRQIQALTGDRNRVR